MMMSGSYEHQQELLGRLLADQGGELGPTPDQLSGYPFLFEVQRRYELMVDRIPADMKADAQIGMEALGGIGYLCLRSYQRHLVVTGSDFNLDNLRSALMHPRTVRLATFLARMDSEENASHESAMRLQRYSYLGSDGLELDFLPPDGYFSISSSVIERAEAKRPEQGYIQTRGCPARRFLPALWVSIVTECLPTLESRLPEPPVVI